MTTSACRAEKRYTSSADHEHHTRSSTANRPDKPENAVEATVAGVSHFGDVLQYVVHTAHRDLLVLVPRTNPARFAVDDRVWCSWSAEDVYLFSARQADVVMASPAHS